MRLLYLCINMEMNIYGLHIYLNYFYNIIYIDNDVLNTSKNKIKGATAPITIILYNIINIINNIKKKDAKMHQKKMQKKASKNTNKKKKKKLVL